MTGVNEIACAGLLIYTTKVDYFSHQAICISVIEWELLNVPENGRPSHETKLILYGTMALIVNMTYTYIII